MCVLELYLFVFCLCEVFVLIFCPTFKAQRMDLLAREKEEKFSEERKNADRKTELNDLIRDILGEERKVRSYNAHEVGSIVFSSDLSPPSLAPRATCTAEK